MHKSLCMKILWNASNCILIIYFSIKLIEIIEFSWQIINLNKMQMTKESALSFCWGGGRKYRATFENGLKVAGRRKLRVIKINSSQ